MPPKRTRRDDQPPLLPTAAWQTRAPLLREPNEVAPPALDPLEQAPIADASAYLTSQPLELGGSRRRAPLSERYVEWAGSRLRQRMRKIGAALGAGMSGVTFACELTNGLQCAVRISKNYGPGDSVQYRREAAKHVLLERLRERYPQMLQNMVQMVDYQLVVGLPFDSIYTPRIAQDADVGDTVPRLVSVLEPCGQTLHLYLRTVVALMPWQQQMMAMGSILCQMLCQLANLQRLLPRFTHGDMHMNNMLMQPVSESSLRGRDALSYRVQLDAGQLDPATGEERAAHLMITLPLNLTSDRLLKIIDLDLAYVEYLPSDAAGSEALVPSQAMSDPERRRYIGDAIQAVTFMVIAYEAALTLANTMQEGQPVLHWTQALLGRLSAGYRVSGAQEREWLLPRILRDDHVFQRYVEVGITVVVPSAPPVAGSRQLDDGHVRVDRIRSELADLCR